MSRTRRRASPHIAEQRLPVDSPLARSLRRFLRHRVAVVGGLIVLMLVLIALTAPLITSYDPVKASLREVNAPPTGRHIFGTDQVGRDVLTRVIYGARVSMSVGIVAVSLTTIIGVIFGGLGGYVGGRTDDLLMRFTELVMMFPTFILMITLATVLEPSIFTLMLVIGLFNWPGLARLVRGQVLSLREAEFVTAARTVGATDWRIMRVHIFPHVVGPVVVSMTLGTAGAILAEAGLSYLGLGVQAPVPSWGGMVSRAANFTALAIFPWQWLPPGIAITLAVLAINFLGDGLRDALDVRSKHRGI